MPPELAARRADQRAPTRPPFNGEQRAYLAWVDHAYQLLATRDPQLHVLDVTDLDPLQTHRAVHQTLDQIDRTDDTAIPTCAGHHRTVTHTP